MVMEIGFVTYMPGAYGEKRPGLLNMPCAKDEIGNWSHDRQKETRHDPLVSVLSFS